MVKIGALVAALVEWFEVASLKTEESDHAAA